MNSVSAIETRIIWLRKLRDKPDTDTQIVPNGTKEQGWVMRDIDFLIKEVKKLKTINKTIHNENFHLRRKLEL